VAVVSPDNMLTKLIEKPKTMQYKLALSGLHYFSEGKELINAIEFQIRKGTSSNQEFYLADAINILIDNGMQIRAERVSQWLDAGTPEDLIETNATLLHHYSESYAKGVVGEANILIHPVYIHESSYVADSIIGPNVAIGKSCSIHGSIIKNTIVDDDSNITEVKLANSLIGRGCSVSGHPIQSMMADNAGIRIYCTIEEMNKTRHPLDP
jgi:glucose-1-phosphate thymidylyltransferase